eukprot:scaffold2601_cov117-Isochrysis_galbana.AAC.11
MAPGSPSLDLEPWRVPVRTPVSRRFGEPFPTALHFGAPVPARRLPSELGTRVLQRSALEARSWQLAAGCTLAHSYTAHSAHVRSNTPTPQITN